MNWLDANVLVSAKNGPFRFAVAPAFWKELDEQASAGRIRVPKMVFDEIVHDGPDDELAKWLKIRKANGFAVKPDENVQAEYRKIADFVVENYESAFAAEFLSVADPWVIAHAKEGNSVVVTFETLCLGAKRVKIPNVCKALDVPTTNLYDMLETLKIKFK